LPSGLPTKTKDFILKHQILIFVIIIPNLMFMCHKRGDQTLLKPEVILPTPQLPATAANALSFTSFLFLTSVTNPSQFLGIMLLLEAGCDHDKEQGALIVCRVGVSGGSSKHMLCKVIAFRDEPSSLVLPSPVRFIEESLKPCFVSFVPTSSQMSLVGFSFIFFNNSTASFFPSLFNL
jgi:hypothetical protein